MSLIPRQARDDGAFFENVMGASERRNFTVVRIIAGCQGAARTEPSPPGRHRRTACDGYRSDSQTSEGLQETLELDHAGGLEAFVGLDDFEFDAVAFI